MKIKSILFALLAALVILPSCKKKENSTDPQNPSGGNDPVVTNEFSARLTTLESYMGKTSTEVVTALVAEGMASVAASDGQINASDTVKGIVCTFYATYSVEKDAVSYLTFEMVSSDASSYVLSTDKFSEAVQAIGQNHTLPSTVALTFNDYAYTIDGEQSSGYDWDGMVSGLSNLSNTTKAIMNWKNSGATYGRLSLIREVLADDGGTSVKYLLQDYTYN